MSGSFLWIEIVILSMVILAMKKGLLMNNRILFFVFSQVLLKYHD